MPEVGEVMFSSAYVCPSVYNNTQKLLTDFHDIFRIGPKWAKEQLISFRGDLIIVWIQEFLKDFFGINWKQPGSSGALSDPMTWFCDRCGFILIYFD